MVNWKNIKINQWLVAFKSFLCIFSIILHQSCTKITPFFQLLFVMYTVVPSSAKKWPFSAALNVAQISNQLQLKNEIIKREFKSKFITVIKREKYGFRAFWWMETWFSASTDHYIFVLLSAIDAKNEIFALDGTTVQLLSTKLQWIWIFRRKQMLCVCISCPLKIFATEL